MDDLLTDITGLTAKERKRLLSWVVSLPEADIVGIFQAAVKIAYKIKDQKPDLPGKITKYCALVVAGRSSGWDTVVGKGYRVAENKQFDDFSHIRKSRAANLISRGRKPILRKKVLSCWGEVKELRAEGHGFRSVSAYLKKHRKIVVSTSYLALLWKELMEEKNVF